MSIEVLNGLGSEAPAAGSAGLFDDAVGMRLQLRKLGIARKRSAGDVQTDADPDLVRVGADILEAESYDAIVRADNEMRAWVRARSISCPLFNGGAYLIKRKLYAEIRDEVRAYLDVKRPVLVDAFLAEYEIKAAEGRRRLASMARDRDYPDVEKVGQSFGGAMRWFSVGSPEALRGVSDDEARREAAELRAEFARSLEAARVALRVEWSELVDRMVDRLTPGADGGRRRFTETLTANAAEFIALFRDRDFTDDRQLRELLDRADAMLRLVPDVDALKSDAELRERTRAVFAGIKAEVDVMTKPAGRGYGDE